LRTPLWTTALLAMALSAAPSAAAGDGLCPAAQRDCLEACPVHFCIEACLTRTCLDAVEVYFDCARDNGCEHGDDACAARVCPDTCMEMADEAACRAWQDGEPGFGAQVLQRFADENEPPPPAPPPPPEPPPPPRPVHGGIQIVDLQISVASTGSAPSTETGAPLPRIVDVGGTCPAGPLQRALADLPGRVQRCLACGDVSDLTGERALSLVWAHDTPTPSAITIGEGSAWHGHLRFCALAAVRELRLEADLDEPCAATLTLEVVFTDPGGTDPNGVR
jgi:hypothetical protein